jgi:hypothetical protein
MELTTFGAIMKFAMDRERAVADIVGKMAGDEKFSSFRELADRIMRESKKNASLLERTRREGINEVILHPITGLDSDAYHFEDRSSEELTARQFGEYLADTLDRLIRFYTEAAPKITNPEAMRVFKRLAAQRLKLKQDINEHVAGLK